MNIEIKKVKIFVTVPRANTEKVRLAICEESGVGVIGNYTHCTVSTNCIGTFKPTEEANPYIGKKNKLEYVEEDKLEVICDINMVKKIIKKIREVHPYEEPAIDIIPLIMENDL